MEFKDKLKERRRLLGISQAELAKKAGITGRTIQNYELGVRTPQNLDIVNKLAVALDTTTQYLLENDDMLVVKAKEAGDVRSAREIKSIVNEISGLFAGGEISEEEKDGIMATLNQAYWIAKEKNKKYTPNKYKTK